VFVFLISSAWTYQLFLCNVDCGILCLYQEVNPPFLLVSATVSSTKLPFLSTRASISEYKCNILVKVDS